MPNGTPVLRLLVDCGEAGERLPLELVMRGERARELAGLRVGQQVRAEGRLRARGGPAPLSLRQQLEVHVTHLSTMSDVNADCGGPAATLQVKV